MNSAELATRVAEAWDAAIDGGVRWAVPFADLHPSVREAMLKVAASAAAAERAKHRATLQALLACVDDAIKEVG